MTVGTRLEDLLYGIRVETGRNIGAAANVGENPRLIAQVNRVQREFYLAYDWPHLRVIKSKPLQAGQRFYDVPAGTNIERICDTALTRDGHVYDVERGIGFEHYAAYNSDLDERADHVQRWDFQFTDPDTQLEVWPIPADNNSSLFIRSLAPISTMAADADKSALDGDLLVLALSAEILERAKNDDAKLYLAKATAHFNSLKARWNDDSRPLRIGFTTATRKPRLSVSRI